MNTITTKALSLFFIGLILSTIGLASTYSEIYSGAHKGDCEFGLSTSGPSQISFINAIDSTQHAHTIFMEECYESEEQDDREEKLGLIHSFSNQTSFLFSRYNYHSTRIGSAQILQNNGRSFRILFAVFRL